MTHCSTNLLNESNNFKLNPCSINYIYDCFEYNIKITNRKKSQVELNQDGQIQVEESLDEAQDNNSLVANVGSPVSDGELLDETNDSSIVTAEVDVLENGIASEEVRLRFIFILHNTHYHNIQKLCRVR